MFKEASLILEPVAVGNIVWQDEGQSVASPETQPRTWKLLWDSVYVEQYPF